MDIRELLEQRKREIYGDSSDYVTENLGDITGEYDDLGDITVEAWEEDNDDMISTEYFTEEEIREIELEASQIEDSDLYIDTVLKETGNDMLQFVGECYIDELILEEALFNCETIEELEAVEESVKDTVRQKKDAAVAKVKELWKKFKAWILNLRDVIVNLFTSGEKLVQKYRAKILEEYKKRGSKIKVKTYKYAHNNTGIQNCLAALRMEFTHMIKTAGGEKINKYDVDKAYRKEINAGEGGKGLKEKAASCVRDNEKKEYTLDQLSIGAILEMAGATKEPINNIKKMGKEEDQFFKEVITKIKNDASGLDKENSEGREALGSYVAAAKKASNMGSALIKYYIAELKAANRACTAIVRRLLNQSTSGGETETKLHKKLAK